ncbi:hypothetical protein D3C86_1887620 [compost metagenome]
MGEALGQRLVAVQAAVRADPHAAGAVHVQHAHPVVGQAARVGHGIAVGEDARAVIAAQAGLAAEPHEALLVLRHRQHRLLRQAVLHVQLLEAQGARRRGGVGRHGRQHAAGQHGGG